MVASIESCRALSGNSPGMRYVDASIGKHSSTTGAPRVVDSSLCCCQANLEPMSLPQRKLLCRFNVNSHRPTQPALSLCMGYVEDRCIVHSLTSCSCPPVSASPPPSGQPQPMDSNPFPRPVQPVPRDVQAQVLVHHTASRDTIPTPRSKVGCRVATKVERKRVLQVSLADRQQQTFNSPHSPHSPLPLHLSPSWPRRSPRRSPSQPSH